MSEQPYTPDEFNVRMEWVTTGIGPDDDLNAEFDRWLAGVKADAWDECVREGEACGYIGAHDAIELGARNPYRDLAGRAEGDGSADR